jgi:hypothetical protein
MPIELIETMKRRTILPHSEDLAGSESPQQQEQKLQARAQKKTRDRINTIKAGKMPNKAIITKDYK